MYQQTSTIHMNTLNQKQINNYLKNTGKNILSSVGCYQVEKLGPQVIKSINGDFFNVTDVVDFPAGNLGVTNTVKQDNKVADKKAA